MKKKQIKTIYEAREGAPFKHEHAQAIGEFIESIPEKTTEEILQRIQKEKKHPIHDYIEWDDTKASHQYRLQQVRNIVNHINIHIVEINSNKAPSRAFLSVKYNDEATIPQYSSIKAIFSDEYQKLQVIKRAWTELKNWRERYQQYKELDKVIEIITPFIDEQEVIA